MPISRRDFLATSAAAAVLGRFGAPALAWAQGQQAQPVFTPIRRNVGIFTMRGGTIGWMVNPAGVVVVDSQFPAEGKACLDGVTVRSGGRPVDLLINTHHHGDHTAGNVSFRGNAKHVVAQAKAAEDMHNPPGGQAPDDMLYPDTTFTDSWSADLGDERVIARFYGRAHTSGDAAITFERANVVHMGDLMFHLRHPVVDRAAGATLRGWQGVLVNTMKDHDNDTVYIFGHAGANQPFTGGRADLQRFHDYLGALLAFVETQVKAGKSRDDINSMRDPLKGFESFGEFGRPGSRDALTCAIDEVMAG